MVFSDNYYILELRRKPKDMEQVLCERELWDKKYVADYSLCKDKTTQNNLTWIKYCVQCIILLQPDFFAQKCTLQELVEEAGHVYIFTLNFIVN